MKFAFGSIITFTKLQCCRKQSLLNSCKMQKNCLDMEGSLVSKDAGMKLNALEQRIGLTKAIQLYKRNISQNSDEGNAFERLAVIYRSRNRIEDEVSVLKKAIAFYEHAVFAENLESMLPMLNQFTKRLKDSESLLSSIRNGQGKGKHA
jgi:tetratricopeptide (TPR) repeat protein